MHESRWAGQFRSRSGPEPLREGYPPTRFRFMHQRRVAPDLAGPRSTDRAPVLPRIGPARAADPVTLPRHDPRHRKAEPDVRPAVAGDPGLRAGVRTGGGPSLRSGFPHRIHDGLRRSRSQRGAARAASMKVSMRSYARAYGATIHYLRRHDAERDLRRHDAERVSYPIAECLRGVAPLS